MKKTLQIQTLPQTSSIKRKGFYLLPLAFCLLHSLLLCYFLAPSLLPSALAQTLTATKTEAENLVQQGLLQYKNGQFIEASRSLEQALTIYQDVGDPMGVINSLKTLGDINFSMGQYASSIDYYQNSLRVAKNIANLPGQANALIGLSNAYLYLGQEQESKKFKQQAEEVTKEFGNPRGSAAFLGNLGLISQSQGQYQQAVNFFQQQLEIYQAIKDAFGISESLNNLATAYASLGKPDDVILVLDQQLQVAKDSNNPLQQASSLGGIAAVYEAQGEYQEAINLYQQQLQIARAKNDIIAVINSLNNQVRLYELQGKYQQAIPLLEQQVQIAKNRKDRLSEGAALNKLASSLLKANDIPQAEKTLQNVLQVWQDIRANLVSKNSYLSEQGVTYNLMQQVAIAQNKPEIALEIAEQGRVRTIVDLLGMRLASDPPGTTAKVAPLQIISPTIKQIQQIAQTEQATIVQYSLISEQEVYIWVIQPSGKVTFRRVDIKSQNTIYPISSLSGTIENSLQSIGVKTDGNQGQAADKKPLLQLYQVLIKPIADLLPKKPTESVIFVPQSSLFLVPFAGLVDVTGQYLIEKYTIQIIPAIQILQLTKFNRSRVLGNKVLVMGNPTMPTVASVIGKPPQPLPPISGGEQEALAIAQLFKTQPLIGNQATKRAFFQQLPLAKIIHLATYGLWDNPQSQGISGAIALAASGSDSGILTANEILDLTNQPKGSPLRAELVTISAGNIGGGKITSDGLIGLSLSLISAGVPSIIISLGSSANAPTAELMTEFYRQLKQTTNKAQALRQAMIITMKKYPNSREWAAFTLIGEAR